MNAVSTIASPRMAPTAARSENLLEIDPARFRDGFDRHPFMIHHRLNDHPLFALSRLIELSTRLPESSVEYNAGNIPVSMDPKQTPRNGLSIQDTIARIEECRSWMVLKNIEQDPQYEALLDECLAEIRPLSEPICPGMMEKEGFIFITSPGSVTPFHIDIEHNFLHQVRGRKTIYIFDRTDRSLVSERDLEDFYDGAHRNLPYQDEFTARAQVFELAPGDSLHFPVTWPHWVKNGNEVSISFSSTFRTPDTHRRGHVYRMNARLRRWHLNPRPPGTGPLRDAIKSLTMRALLKSQRLLGGSKKDAGSRGYGKA